MDLKVDRSCETCKWCEKDYVKDGPCDICHYIGDSDILSHWEADESIKTCDNCRYLSIQFDGHPECHECIDSPNGLPYWEEGENYIYESKSNYNDRKR